MLAQRPREGNRRASRYAHFKNVRLVAICDIDPARLALLQMKSAARGGAWIRT